MKKIIISMIGSCMFLFIVWTLVAYAKYGSEMVNYRLDFESTFRYFAINNTFQGKTFWDILKDFTEGAKKMLSYSVVGKINDAINGNTNNVPLAFMLVLTLLNGLIDPFFTILYSMYVMVYGFAIIIEVILYLTAFVTAVLDFVFSPVFVPSSTNPWLQSLQVCKLFFF